MTPPTRPRRRWVLPVAFTGTFAIGVGIGAATVEEPEPEIVTETVVETETITEEVEVEVIEEVEVETLPFSCEKAIEAGGLLIESLLSWGDFVSADEMEIAEDAAFDWGFYSETCKDFAK